MAALIGASVPRLEDGPLLTGTARFLDDIKLPELLDVAFLRSAHAHAAVNSIDVEAARKLPGVHAVLTMDDLAPALTGARMPLGASPGKATAPITPYVLSGREVAFVGEVVAMVVAENRYIAEDAAGLIHIDYDPLVAVVDARTAPEPRSPTVRRETTSNVLSVQKVGYGDVAEAFAGAAYVFKEDLWQHRGCGHPLEGRGVVAEWRPDGGLNVWSSTQMPWGATKLPGWAASAPPQRSRQLPSIS